MATRTQKMQVGLFLVICVVIMVAGALIISGFKGGTRTPYFVEFGESVLGVNRGGLVEYLGVPVGTVKDIWVTEENKPRAEILVEDDKVTLRQGVQAQLVIYSLATGMMAISLVGGEVESSVLPPGSLIPTKPSVLGEATTSIPEILNNVNDIADKLSSGLNGIEDGQLTDTLVEVQGAVDDVRSALQVTRATVSDTGYKVGEGLEEVQDLLKDLRAEVKPIAEKIQKLADNADELVTTTREKMEPLDIGKTQQGVQDTLDSLNALAKSLNTTSDDIQETTKVMMHEADNVEYTLRSTMGTLSESLEAVRRLAEQLERDPASIVHGKGKVKGE